MNLTSLSRRALATAAVACALVGAGGVGITPAPAAAAAVPAPQTLALAFAQPGTGVEYHGLLYFSGGTSTTGSELWATDGTPAGTRVVKELAPGGSSSQPDHLIVYKDRLFFTAYTPDTGIEWFSTDGTGAGTQLLRDGVSGGDGSNPGPAVVAAGLLWFAARDSQHGRELWTSDGTTAGTHETIEIRTGDSSSSPEELTSLGDRVVFAATGNSGVSKPWVAAVSAPVRRLDTFDAAIDLSPEEFTRLGDHVVFAAGTPSSDGEELWVTSGEQGDAREIKDIYPGPVSSAPRELTVLGNRVWFAATRPGEGAELWSSDGTTDGTTLAKNIFPGAAGSAPSNLRVAGDRLLFNADDGVHGTELWSSPDATNADFHLVLDSLAGAGAGTLPGPDLLATGLAGASVYTGVSSSGKEPWVTDGTAAGTQQVADLTPGPGDSTPFAIGVLGNTVVFVARVGSEFTLYSWTPGRVAAAGTSTTSAHAKRHYSPGQARRKHIRVPVTVSNGQGAALGGGTVTLVLHGKVVGSAPLVNGQVKVRISKRLRPGHTYRVTAVWSGTTEVAGSSSAEFRVRIARSRRR